MDEAFSGGLSIAVFVIVCILVCMPTLVYICYRTMVKCRNQSVDEGELSIRPPHFDLTPNCSASITSSASVASLAITTRRSSIDDISSSPHLQRTYVQQQPPPYDSLPIISQLHGIVSSRSHSGYNYSTELSFYYIRDSQVTQVSPPPPSYEIAVNMQKPSNEVIDV